jgi:capsular polysaccharide export protein
LEFSDSGVQPPRGDTERPAADASRNFLLLQGPAGSFFARLGEQLRTRRHGVFRIHFNGGDRLFWRGGGAEDFAGDHAQWPQFLGERLGRWAVTDLVLFGDCRPLHQVAIRIARLRRVRVHVFEEGYLRPNWLTLEAEGVNRLSSLPREPAWYREAAQQLPPWDAGTPIPSSFPRRAAVDVAYNFANLLLAPNYPGYRTHKPWHPLQEYRAGARRFFGKPAARQRATRLIELLLADTRPYYLFPLQLETDAQIRFHSGFGSMAPPIEAVIESFAAQAPEQARLVVTEHPLDTGVFDLGQVTREQAERRGVADRVVFLQGGSPEALLRGSRGIVTVNSTIGLLALSYGLPVKTLGHAIYDLPGLACQRPLDQFWLAGSAPDAVLFDCFRRVVAARAQINGGLYSALGLRLAAEAAAQRLSAAPPQTLPAPNRPHPAAATPSDWPLGEQQ